MDNIKSAWPRWELIEEIGKGAFGSVYKAKREQLGDEFFSAIKVIRVIPDEIEIKDYRRKGIDDRTIQTYYKEKAISLMNEIQIMESLKSANGIVMIEDSEILPDETTSGWNIFIRMELLKNIIDYYDENDVTVRTVLKIGMDISSALIACEQKNIIHRDIKPSNIFVNSFGQFKLGDFGISKELSSYTSTMTQIGTVNYMAPEIWRGEKKYDNTVDIYSLGLVLYYYLNQLRFPFEPGINEPFSPKSIENAIGRRLNGDVFPKAIYANDSLMSIINKACAYAPSQRFRSASELHSALQREYNNPLNITTLNQVVNTKNREFSKEDSDKGNSEKATQKDNIQEDKTVSAFDSAFWGTIYSDEESIHNTTNKERKQDDTANKASSTRTKQTKTVKTDNHDPKPKKETQTDNSNENKQHNTFSDTNSVPRGINVKTTIRITFDEAFRGTEKAIVLPIQHKCKMCEGKGWVQSAHFFSKGDKKNICKQCNGKKISYEKKELTIKVPAGIDNGQIIRIKNLGYYSNDYSEDRRGDLLVTVNIDDDANFVRDGFDLSTNIFISKEIARAGDTIPVDLYDGRIMLTIVPGTIKGQKYRIQGRGIPWLNNNDIRGDFYVVIAGLV